MSSKKLIVLLCALSLVVLAGCKRGSICAPTGYAAPAVIPAAYSTTTVAAAPVVSTTGFSIGASASLGLPTLAVQESYAVAAAPAYAAPAPQYAPQFPQAPQYAPAPQAYLEK